MEGSRLGPYELLAGLGTGGMGKVYRAEVVGAASGVETGGVVALKVIHAHLLETPGFFKRFLREADLGRTIEHENVVRTYDCDALLHEGVQQNFLVMEYVEGQTLRDLLQELERVPEELCRHIGREVARGLAAIHGAGVVHRDLKPENVLITDEHVVKVMDLGVARFQDEALRLSQAGTFVGSLEYAAPEQFRTADGESDGRADLHALGVVLYELSTGQHPYRDEDAGRVIGRILNEEPRKAGEVNPQLSPFFEETVHTLIAKKREERFGSAGEVALVLEEGEQSEWWTARAKALRIETKRPLRRIRVPRETALYGRDDDLSVLHAAYEQAKAGNGRVLLIEGEAGIGKTRLVDEFVGRLRQEGEDVNFLFGSYPAGGAATAAGAFSTAYREHFGEQDLDATLSGYLRATPILVPAFAALLRGESTPTGAEALTKDSLQTVFVHATRGLAAERTTLVLIDDLHFAPEAGRALFASLSLAAPGHRLLLIGTIRPGAAVDWVAEVDRHEHASRRELSRLGPKDLLHLLQDSFRSERLAHELAGQIAIKSDGNPFFAFEIIRSLREGRYITQQADGTWISTQVIQDIQIPSSVLDLIQARLRDLTEEENDLLEVAACFGFEFDPSVIAEAVGTARLPTLKRLGRIEKAHRLIRSAGRHYTFDHQQVQEALRAGLHPQLREEYHAAIAAALEAREGAAEKAPKELAGSLCVDLCEHYLKGARGESALRYLGAALEHLSKSYWHDQAVALADRALDAPDLLKGPARLKVLMGKGVRLASMGRGDAEEAVLTEARILAEATEDLEALAAIEAAAGWHLLRAGRAKEARPLFERARDISETPTARKGKANALYGLGVVCLRLGRYEEAQAHQREALTLFEEVGDHAARARVLSSQAMTAHHAGDLAASRAHALEALALAKENGDLHAEAASSGILGWLLQSLGELDGSLAHQRRALAICEQTGERMGVASATGNLGLVSITRGCMEEALTYLRRTAAICRETGNKTNLAVSTGNQGAVLLSLGSTEEATAHFQRALVSARETGDRRPEGYWLDGLGQAAEQTGNVADAERLYGEALSLRRELGYGKGIAQTLTSLGALLADQGRNEDALPILTEALTVARELRLPGIEVTALCRMALLPGGDVQVASDAFEENRKQLGHAQSMASRFLLWKATRNAAQLEQAKHLLDHLVMHAPGEYHTSMIESVPLHRDIVEAWGELGERAERDGEVS